MPRTIFISNRLPVTVHTEGGSISTTPSIGGLATGMQSVHEGGSSLWVGWDGLDADVSDSDQLAAIEAHLGDQHACVPVFLGSRDIHGFYEGFSNTTIWPLFHYFPNKTGYVDEYWAQYREVNGKFFHRVASLLEEGDTVWIHDYQLMLLPQLIRAAFPSVVIGFFLHIPFPSYEIYRLLPWRKDILLGMLGADLIGFHTYDYVRHFVSSARRLLHMDHHLGVMVHERRPVRVDAFPMGIDYRRYADALTHESVQTELAEARTRLAGRRMVLSVDRLDYTKGIPERLRAWHLFLTRHPEQREHCTLILIVAPSRTGVEKYQDLLREIRELVAGINGEYGTLGWTPVEFFFRSFGFDSLCALYGAADALLVTPLRDGMNLVAKEYLATRQDLGGALILSETAGAASELGEAWLVNPNNIAEIAEALHSALETPSGILAEKNATMHERLHRYDVHSWARDFFHKLGLSTQVRERYLAKRIRDREQEAILADYRRAGRRLLLLDYDGTLVGFKDKPRDAAPDPALLALLGKLAADPANEVVIISGRDHLTLGSWLGDLPLSLVADHGVWLRDRGGDWHTIEALGDEWKAVIRPVLDVHRDRTPRSHIEEKSYSLAWHYRSCDPDLASIRVSELKEALINLTHNLNIGLLEGNKVIEVKDQRINKGRGASLWLGREAWDFALAMGDDRTDEDMFEAMPVRSITIKVGSDATAARYTLPSVDRVRDFLEALAR